jgi:hypothetical protein
MSGIVDGGAGGFDSMVLDGGSFATVVYTATGPNSGDRSRRRRLAYDGFESIFDNARPPTASSGRATQRQRG